MLESKWSMGDALFPVELSDVYVKLPGDGRQSETRGHNFVRAGSFSAIVALDNRLVFSVVAPDYKLVTNEDALALGRICFREIFTITDIAKMKPFNVIMPKTRSFCHMDFVHDGAQFDPFKKDPWTPYLRITNSYNRMFALNFDLGFCRGICKNGVIFGKKNIEFKFVHSKRANDPEVEFKLRAGELLALETEFTEALLNLKRFHVPRVVMWALACKVFRQSLSVNASPRQQEIWETKNEAIDNLADEYFSKLGENGYAALNVLTDFASRPVGMISAEQRIDRLQRLSGSWMGEFIEAIESREFNFESYLGEYARLVA